MIKIATQLFLLALICTTNSYADEIYKSVDENGKVTYSSTPTQNNEESIKVDITPPPSKEDIEAAKELQEKNQKAAEILDKNREQRKKVISEENQLKREKQKQSQQKQQAEQNNDDQDNVYPYYQRHPAGNRPIRPRPVILPIRR